MELEIVTATDGRISINILDEVAIDEEDLNSEFISLPGYTAYWTAVTARYGLKVQAMHRDFETWWGERYDAAFKALEKDTGRKPNISSAEYLVKVKHTSEYNEKKVALEEAETNLTILKGICEALHVKLQCLMQLAKRSSLEYDAVEPTVKSNRFSGSRRGDEQTEEAATLINSVIGKGRKIV